MYGFPDFMKYFNGITDNDLKGCQKNRYDSEKGIIK